MIETDWVRVSGTTLGKVAGKSHNKDEIFSWNFNGEKDLAMGKTKKQNKGNRNAKASRLVQTWQW